MPKKKLLVLLGAGSSIELGMPSVGDVGRLMSSWATGWGNSDDYVYVADRYSNPIARAVSDCYGPLKEKLVTFSEREGYSPDIAANYERILEHLLLIANAIGLGDGTPTMIDPSLLDKLFDAEALFPSSYKSWEHNKRDIFEAELQRMVAYNQFAYLLDRLAKTIRDKCRLFDTASEKFKNYKAIFAGLSAEFDVGVYTLNYDCLAKLALPDSFTGFDEGLGFFSPETVHRRQKWHFIYHLHGSVHHTLASDEGPIHWQADLDTLFRDGGEHPRIDSRTDGKYVPITTLVGGGSKLDQMLSEPFHSLHSNFARSVYRADAILIAGYGFGDPHINRGLLNLLYFMELRRRPPIVVLDYAPRDTATFFSRGDDWSRGLRVTLLTAPAIDGAGYRRRGDSIASLLSDRLPEVIPEQRCAIWYGGFLSSLTRLNNFIAWLDGNPRAFE
jgi:hypothetical protein